jgi:outer membrane murein-binding lipoprotein Lpp
MKTKIKCFLSAVVSASVLTVGCISPYAKDWEYKVVALGNANTARSVESQESVLNAQGKEGWIFVQEDGGSLLQTTREIE